jgi:hypothetical protein
MAARADRPPFGLDPLALHLSRICAEFFVAQVGPVSGLDPRLACTVPVLVRLLGGPPAVRLAVGSKRPHCCGGSLLQSV